MKRPVYMDCHATTPVDPRVLDRMLPFFSEEYGNAASRNHEFGWKAEAAVDLAREQVAALIGGSPKEIVWTSGATESDNLALLGAAQARADRGDHVVTCVTEHPAVLDAARHLETKGFRVTRLPVDETGLVDLEALADTVDERTILVSIMTANNEIGTIQPVAEISRIVKDRSPDTLVHTDAVQAVGKIPVDVEELGVDLLSMSGHKVYGPKGVGALWVRRRRPTVRLAPQLHGGGHERGMRSGTLNVPGIVGMGAALEIAGAGMEAERARVGELRDRLHAAIAAEVPDVILNGHPVRRIPNNLNLSFPSVEAEDLIERMPDVCVSTGAACSSASLEPSHVIAALGVGDARAQTSIRYGLGRFHTREEIDFVAGETIRGVRALRGAVRSGGETE